MARSSDVTAGMMPNQAWKAARAWWISMPAPIIARIAEATRKVVAEEEFQRVLIASGFEPVLDSGPEEARQFIAAETARWLPIMQAAHFKLE